MAEENPENLKGMRRVAALVGHSAEYSIAIALVAVCLIVGLAVWLLQPGAPPVSTPDQPASQTSAAHASASTGADEQAALGAWKQRLEGGFDQADQKQRRAEEDRNRQERQKQDEESSKARYKAQLAAASAAPAASAPDLSPPITFAPPKAVLPKSQAVRVNAAIDWTSCKRPAYPDMSMRKKEEGVVTIEIDLDADAHILRSRIASSSGHERLDLATQHAIEKCRFHPATVDGLPQASTAVVRFTWALS